MESAKSCMRRWKRSLLTDGRSSVWGKGAPSGPMSGGSAALATGALEEEALGAAAGATDELGAAVAILLGASNATGEGAGTGETLADVGAVAAGVETASPRQASAVSSTEQPKIRTHRSRMVEPS